MARIGHIALLTKDTEKLAAFYRASFGLNEVARTGEASEHGQAILEFRRVLFRSNGFCMYSMNTVMAFRAITVFMEYIQNPLLQNVAWIGGVDQ